MKQLILITKQSIDLLESFTNYLKSKHYSQSSQYYLPLHVREFLHYQESNHKQLKDWLPDDFLNFMDYLKNRPNVRGGGALSNAHLNKIIQSLQLLQQYLNAVERLDFYVKLSQNKVISQEIEIYSKEDIANLYEQCDSSKTGLRMRSILALCYGCGLRKGEAIALNMEDIWWEQSLLQVRKSKTGKGRLVPMAKGVQLDLRTYIYHARPKLEKQNYSSAFLLSTYSNRMSASGLYKAFERHLQSANYPKAGLHKLRHSIASHLAQSGMSSEQISRFLGHTSLDSTQIYVHRKIH